MIFLPLCIVAVLALAAHFGDALQSHIRINDRLARVTQDEEFIDTPGTPQNLCGDSTFEAVDVNGPLRHDCEYLMSTTKRNPDGFWMASNFGSDGTRWVEFTRLRSCGVKVRRTDGLSGDVPSVEFLVYIWFHVLLTD